AVGRVVGGQPVQEVDDGIPLAALVVVRREHDARVDAACERDGREVLVELLRLAQDGRGRGGATRKRDDDDNDGETRRQPRLHPATVPSGSVALLASIV